MRATYHGAATCTIPLNNAIVPESRGGSFVVEGIALVLVDLEQNLGMEVGDRDLVASTGPQCTQGPKCDHGVDSSPRRKKLKENIPRISWYICVLGNRFN